MPYCVQANIKGGAVSVMVTSAREALAKIAELIELGHSDVHVRDLHGRYIGDASLRIEAAADDAGSPDV
jgi:hypothetical protein